MGESGDIFFPKLDESGDSITFDQLRELFESQNVSISEIIEVLKDYLPNIKNIEPEKGCVIPNKIIN